MMGGCTTETYKGKNKQKETQSQTVEDDSEELSLAEQTRKTPDIFSDNKLEQTIPVNGEEFSLSIMYDTENYPTDQWAITEAKNLGIEVKTTEMPDDTKVFIDNVHIDSSILSMEPEFNAIPTDSMDDNTHTSLYPGFPISNDISYYGIFSIRGYSETLISGYSRGYYTKRYGFGSTKGTTKEKRVTEQDLKEALVYGQKFQIVYDLWIQKENYKFPYMQSVISEFIIPTEFYVKSEKDAFHTLYLPAKWKGENHFIIQVNELGEWRNASFDNNTFNLQ